MNAASIDIKDALVTQFGYVFGQDIHIGKQPEAPVDCVTVYDTGNNPESDLCGDINAYVGVSIRVRNAGYLQGWNEAQAIVDFLTVKANEILGGTFYTRIKVANGPIPLGYDDKNKVNFSINLEIQRRI